MNKNERTNATILSAIVITLLSTMAFVFVGSTDLSQKAIGQAEEIFGENATFTEEIEGTSPTANQTAAPAAPTANQTAAPAAPTSVPTANETAPATNLTRADIESFRENLNSARQGVQDNDAQTALDSINAADSTLYVLIVEEPKGPAAEKLSALQDTLDTARESLRANALEKALQDLNNADSQVLVITEMLPAEEPEEPEESD
ncbi:MAG: hypothetical protein WBL49_09440, partial [Nitrososphaeraceae archaeon]|jgi:hypothetical protein